jgi:uncharacterized protein YciI
VPIYAFICRDGGNKTQLRRDLLLDHLRYIDTVLDHVVVAGPCPPVQAGDGRQFEGSIMMYRAETAAAARSMFENDPYFKAKVWDSCEMMVFSPVAGDYIGGRTWQIVDGKVTRTEPRRNP